MYPHLSLSLSIDPPMQWYNWFLTLDSYLHYCTPLLLHNNTLLASVAALLLLLLLSDSFYSIVNTMLMRVPVKYWFLLFPFVNVQIGSGENDQTQDITVLHRKLMELQRQRRSQAAHQQMMLMTTPRPSPSPTEHHHHGHHQPHIANRNNMNMLLTVNPTPPGPPTTPNLDPERVSTHLITDSTTKLYVI